MERYSPALVLALGILTSIAILGFGSLLLQLVRLQLPAPWRQATAMLLGIQVMSLCVQVAAMSALSSRGVLIAIWGFVVAIGLVALLRRAPAAIPSAASITPTPEVLLRIVTGISVAAALIVAIAPSTKIDELFYHMLLPSRIVTEGVLRFHQEPWPAAILPQMAYQIATAPLHALGLPDAANLVSASLGVTMLWFAWSLIRQAKAPLPWAGLWTATLAVGLHGVVLQVTGGSHAMGGLAMAASTVAFCMRRSLIAELGPVKYCAMVSLLLVAAASSKISLLPLAGVMLIGSCGAIVWSGNKARVPLLAALAAPWLILYLPIVIWTWRNSGSPFGPLLSAAMPWSVYDPAGIGESIRVSRALNQSVFDLVGISAFYSPLLWLGAIGALTLTTLDAMTRAAATALLALQCVLIFLLLPHDPRFLGGLHFGLAIVFAVAAKQQILAAFALRPTMQWIAMALVIPWAAVQVYYALTFVPVVLGLEAKEAFYGRLVAFHSDYRRLDSLLPKDAVLLCRDFRLSAVYAPRPIFMDPRDLPKGSKVFLFASAESEPNIEPIAGFKRGSTVYENPRALVEVYRTPNRPPVVAPLKVTALTRD